jgi:pilus assembly protein CpaF
VTVDAALVAKVRSRLADDVAPPTTARVAALVREEAGVRGAAQVLAAVEVLRSELIGAGPLEVLLHEPGVTDVLVNGPDEVWVDRGRGLERADVQFGSDREIRRLAARLAAAAGRRLDDAVPYADIRLADGVRLHAVLPPVSPGGVCLSFRVPRRRAFTLEEFVDMGAMPRVGAELLAAVVASRASFVVTGGTGTGKTTLLSTLLGCVDPRERVVLVEDSGELRPDHPHVVRLEARAPNIEGAGAIELRALVRHALRMRPDRLVVGEVRGAECVDLLAALNVGHDGGAGTLHANSVVDVPARIEALCTAAGLSREAAHSQLGAGLRIVIHLARRHDGLRVLDSVGVVIRRDDGLVEVQPAVRRDDGRRDDGRRDDGRRDDGRRDDGRRDDERWVDDVGRGALDRVLDA